LNLVPGRFTLPNIESRCNQLKLGHPPQWWPSVGVSLRAGVGVIGSVNKRVENLARFGCVFLAHQDSVSRARPCKVFTHSSRGVTLDHCLNAGTFERALGQVRLRADKVLLDDDKLGVVHTSSICPNEWERGLLGEFVGADSGGDSGELGGTLPSEKNVLVERGNRKSGGKPPHSEGVAILGAGASNQLQ